MDYSTNICTISSDVYFGKGILLGMNIVGVIWIVCNMMNFCSDPLGEKLKTKLRILDDDNTKLVDEIDSLNEEIMTLRVKRRRCSDTAEVSTSVCQDILKDITARQEVTSLAERLQKISDDIDERLNKVD
jgi:hypothetical protein